MARVTGGGAERGERIPRIRKAELIVAANRRRAEQAFRQGNISAAIQSVEHSARVESSDSQVGPTKNVTPRIDRRRGRGAQGDQ